MSQWHLVLGDEEGRLRVIPMTEGETICGRDEGCDLRFPDHAVSRSHARLVTEGDRLLVEDVGSRGGTFVNGARIQGRVALDDGDHVRLGRTTLLVRSGAPPEIDDDTVASRDAQSETTTRVLFELAPPGPGEDGTESPEHLSLLSDVGSALQESEDLVDALSILLGVCFDIYAPDHGVILVADDDDSFVPAVAHPEHTTNSVARSVLERAVSGHVTVVAEEAQSEFEDSASVRLLAIRSVLCCPLIHADRVIGAIYLDARSGRLNTRREDLGLLGLIAGYAATAVQNDRLEREISRGRAEFDVTLEPWIVQSEVMREAMDHLDSLVAARSPVVIEGEPGTGKFLAARHLHARGARAGAPLRVVDVERSSGLELRDALQTVTRACSTSGRRSGGSLVLRHVEALDPSAQPMVVEFLEAVAAETDAPRVLVTLEGSREDWAQREDVDPRLVEAVGGARLRIPSLRDRKEDVLPLARHFLRRRDASSTSTSLDRDAERVLTRSKFRDDNVRGLRRAIELAATLADGNTIRPEHLFTGPPVRNHRLEFDLGKLSLVRWLVRRPVHEFGQFSVAAFFVFLIVACLVFAGTGVGRVANGMVWGLWWPALLLAFVLLGRVWCAVCPVSRLSRLTRRLVHGKARAPGWLKTHTGFVTAASFLLIVWSEAFFDMPHHPVATGIFLLSLLVVATLGVAVFEREAWCRHGCPLGSLAAGYSVTAPLHVHANPAICTSECRTHECFKGSDVEAGCPMHVHPMYAKDAHLCKLCMSCVRNCPNGSARLWFRLPLQDVWSVSELNPVLVPVAWVAFTTAPLLLAFGAPGRATAHGSGFSVLLLAATAMAILASKVVDRWLERTPDPIAPRRVAFSLLLLAWGPLMAFHLGHVPKLEHLEVRQGGEAALQSAAMGSGVSILVVFQVLAIAVAAIGATIALMTVRHRQEPRSRARRGWWLLALVCAVYTVANTAVVF